MVLKVYGVPGSTATRRVTVVFKELSVPYELVPVDLKTAQHKTPEYLRHQPFGQIPYIDDDGFELFESRAIARYLVAKYGKDSGLVPAGLQENAKFEQAVSIEQNDFDPFASGINFEKFAKPLRGLQPDEQRVAEHSTTLAAKLKVYDTVLSKQKYLAGDQVTLADLFHLPVGANITERVGVTLLTSEETPNVARWWKDISTRPAWIAVQDELKQA